MATPKIEARYFEDKTSALTVHDILRRSEELSWAPLEKTRGRFGFTKSRYWFRFLIPESELKYSAADPVMLEIPYAYNERMSLYFTRGKEVFKSVSTGMGVPLSERGPSVLRTGHTSFRLSAPRTSDTEYFLSVEGVFPVSAPLRLWEAPDYSYHHWTSVLFVGVFLGFLALAGIVNGVMGAILHSKIYWNYSLFVVSIFMLYLAHEGLTILLLWPESSWWAIREFHVYGSLTIIFYVQFVCEFLESKVNFPWLDRALLTLMGVSTARGIWLVVSPHSQLVAQVGELSIVLINTLVLVVAFRALKLGIRSARYFLLSSLVFNVAMVLFVIQETNLIWIGEFMSRAPHVGTALEVLLLSLALADRIKQVNLELAFQKAAVIQADKMSALGRLAGEIAHEINNPLAIIHGNASLLSQLELGPQAKDFARTIEQTAMRISKVVKGMRALARDTRSDPVQSTPLASILQDTLILCQDRISSAGVKFFSPEPDPGLFLRCRATEISQVLVNLLGNAADATNGRADGWIKIEAVRNGSMLEIFVSDNGSGIPKSIRARIHEPFFTTKEAGKGLGLGLSISRTIVENHGGKLWLDESSQFTRFIFSIPLAS